MTLILRFLPAAKTAGFLLAMPLVFALVACSRPDGSNHPQVQSPFLLPTAVPTSIIIGVTEAQIAEAASAGIQFFDTFDFSGVSSGRRPLSGRLPDLSPIAAVWSAIPDQWELRGTHVGPGFRAPETIVAIVETGVSGATIEIQAARLSGELGIVFRYESEDDWYAVRLDGQSLVIERLIGGALTELSRGDLEWAPSSRTRTLSVIDAGNRIETFLDGVKVTSIDSVEPPPGTRVGILSRDSDDNQFHSISVSSDQ